MTYVAGIGLKSDIKWAATRNGNLGDRVAAESVRKRTQSPTSEFLYPAFGLQLSPVFAGAAMALSSVSIVTNALRLNHVKL